MAEESVSVRLFDDNDFTTDLHAEDIQMIMNPELKKRRGGATAEVLEEFSAVIKEKEEHSSREHSADVGKDKTKDDVDDDEEVSYSRCCHFIEFVYAI